MPISEDDRTGGGVNPRRCSRLWTRSGQRGAAVVCTGPEAVSVQVRKHPAALSESCCNAASWARVETLAYPGSSPTTTHWSKTHLGGSWRHTGFGQQFCTNPLPRPHGKAVPGGGVCQNRSSAAHSGRPGPRVTPPPPADGFRPYQMLQMGPSALLLARSHSQQAPPASAAAIAGWTGPRCRQGR